MLAYLLLCAEFKTSHASNDFVVERESEREARGIIIFDGTLAAL
jgi:hypothetical protein